MPASASARVWAATAAAVVGAIAPDRMETLARARELGLDAAAFLADNDAHRFFGALDDLIRTGPTGTNVADLQIVLVS